MHFLPTSAPLHGTSVTVDEPASMPFYLEPIVCLRVGMCTRWVWTGVQGRYSIRQHPSLLKSSGLCLLTPPPTPHPRSTDPPSSPSLSLLQMLCVGIIQCVAFSDALLSLVICIEVFSMSFLGLIADFFSVQNNIFLSGWARGYLFIHLLKLLSSFCSYE